jgi:hypothetical protein
VSLALTRPLRLCLLRVLLCVIRCYKLSPFQAHWGRWHCTSFLRPECLFTVHVGSGSSALSCGVFLPLLLLQAFLLLIAGHVLLLLPAGLFVYSSHGTWVFPPLLCFPPSAIFTSFPTSGCWVCATAPALSSQARLVYLQFREGFLFPPLQRSGCPTLIATCLYFSYCLLLSFSFFPGWGSVCPGGYADLALGFLWKYCIPLISPCLHLPKPSGHGCLVARGPSWFLRLTWSGDSLLRLEVWRGQSFACSWWPCLQGVSPASLQDFTLGGTLSASSLLPPSWNLLLASTFKSLHHNKRRTVPSTHQTSGSQETLMN